MNPKVVRDSDRIKTVNPTGPRDSEKFVGADPFDEFNKNLNKKADVVKGQRQAPGEPVAPVADPFDQFNESLKKKDLSGTESVTSASDGAVTAAPSISGSPGTSDGLKKALEGSRNFLSEDINKGSLNNVFGPGGALAIPGVGPAGAKPTSPPPGKEPLGVLAYSPETDPDPVNRTLATPESVSQYLVDRRKAISAEIDGLNRQRNALTKMEQTFTGPGMGSAGTTKITDPAQYNQLSAQIKEKSDYLKKLQASATDLIGEQVVREQLRKSSKSIGSPRELGRRLVQMADKSYDAQLAALEETKSPLGIIPEADLERSGLNILKKYLMLNEDVENREMLINMVNEKEASFDERNFELTGARVRHKIGAVLQKESGWAGNIMRRQPGDTELIDAAQKANLTPSEMKIFNQYVLPLERRNIGTDIPMSGFVNKFGEAVTQGVVGITNVLRSNTERLYESLNQEADTRYDEVGEFQRDKGELGQLEKKAKSSEGVNATEKKRINELKRYVDVRTFANKFWDGAGDMTGQVAYQASVARLFGAAGTLVGKAPLVGGIISKATTIKGGADTANLMVSSFVTSFDNHAKEASMLMPGKDQAWQRRGYAFIMAGVEGLSERIFPDTKILDAFKKSISPDVVRLAARLSSSEISEEAAKSRLKDIISNKLAPFAKSFAKAEFQEASEESVVDFATGISETVFAGKDFDAQETFGNAADTFLTTMAYSPFVSGMASVRDTRKAMYGKSGLYRMATDPETYRRELFRQQQEGTLTEAEVNQKLKIINTAANIATQLPVRKSLDPRQNVELGQMSDQWKQNIAAIGNRTDIDDAEKEKLKAEEDTRHAQEQSDYVKKVGRDNISALDYPDRASYLTHRLNELLLEEEIKNSTDDVVKADKQRQLDRSKKIREGIFKGDIIVGNNLEEIAISPDLAQSLDITPLSEADPDSLPIDISQPKKQENDEQKANPVSTETAQPDKLGSEESNVSGSVGQQNETGEQAVSTPQEGVTPGVTPEGGAASSLPSGMTEEQFNALPQKAKDKIIAQQKPKANAVQEQSPAEGVLREQGVQGEGGLQAVEQGNAQGENTASESQEKVSPYQDWASRGRSLRKNGTPIEGAENLAMPLAREIFEDKSIVNQLPPAYRTVEGIYSMLGGGQQDLYQALDYAAEKAAREANPVTTNASRETANSEVQEMVKEDLIPAAFKGIATDDPQGFLRFVAQQANNLNAQGEVNTFGNPAAGTLASFGKPLVDLANEQFPEYAQKGAKAGVEGAASSPAATQTGTAAAQGTQPSETNATGTATPDAGVSRQPLDTIATDLTRFQMRENPFSQESVDKIVNDYDPAALDPVLLYRDPNGSTYILAGHSRVEAHRQLTNLPDSDARKQAAIEKGFQPGNIQARFFEGTPDQARVAARRSNDRNTSNEDWEKAQTIRDFRREGMSEDDIVDQSKIDHRNQWRYFYNMSFLNPNGKAIETLKQFSKNTDVKAVNDIRKAIQWIGAVRERYPDTITNAHENEMFDFLMDKGKSTTITRENDFLSLVDAVANAMYFDASGPLNLSRIKSKSAAEVAYDAEEAELKAAIKERQDAIKNLRARLNDPNNPGFIGTDDPGYQTAKRVADQREGLLQQELDSLRKELSDHLKDKGKIISAGIAQPGLFDSNQLTPQETTELNDALAEDGINIENISEHESQQRRNERPAEGDAQGSDISTETGTDSQAIPVTENDQSASQGQDQSRPAVQAKAKRSSPSVTLTPEQTAVVDQADQLGNQYQGTSMFANSLLAQAVMSSKVYVETLRMGKHPNNKKVTAADVADLIDRLENNVAVMEKFPPTQPSGPQEVTPVDEIDPVLEEKRKKLAETKQAFRDALRKQRGNLNSGLPIDPEVVANGVKMIAAYADLGIYKFKQIIADIADTFGNDYLDQDNLNALRGVYSYHRSNLPKEERSQFDSEDAVDNIIDNEINISNAPSTADDLERDRARRNTENAVRPGIVSNDRQRDDVDNGRDGESVIERVQPIDSPGILPFDAATVGERGDSGLPIAEQLDGLVTSPAGDPDAGRGSAIDESGIPPVGRRIESVDGVAAEIAELGIEQKIALQIAAEPIAVVPMDLANIKATLPFLMEGQHTDVLAAEQRFFGERDNAEKLHGKGILFTNGTGTGKTLTGLGIAKRFIKQGRNRVLIVTPSDTKNEDWKKESEGFLQMPVHKVTDTTDGGQPTGLNVTTYANFRQNPFLNQRQWDLVLYDESHKINSNGQGTDTAGEDAHRRTTKTPSVARSLAKEELNYDVKVRQFREANNSQGIKELESQVRQRALEIFRQTNVVFLSATPFSYHPNLTYGDGYLFSIREQMQEQEGRSLGYNQPNAFNEFYLQNFGYRMRYNKLTVPESGVDVDLMERQFTERLKRSGVVVSRKLKVDKDYSREFVQVDTVEGSEIDRGIDAMSNHELYPVLSSNMHRHFSFLYKNQLMEAIKARWAVDRIKQHLELGRKVVVFHSYIENEPKHPFDFSASDFMSPDNADYRRLQDEIQNFHADNPEFRRLDMSNLKSPIQTLQEAFGEKVLLFNGQVKKKDRGTNKDKFNQDNSGFDIIVVQSQAGKEGISLHDKTGVHQRALINLGMPYAPSDAIQSEGRVYRTGQKTDAVLEYASLGLNFEKFAYSDKINGRVRTAENLALGEESRNLETSFKEAYNNPSTGPASLQQGKGGKDYDARMEEASEFERSKTYYFARGKRSARDKQGVEGDYYATPEPLGLKVVEWLNAVPNERLLEPSAGHGAIARFMPKTTTNTFIEPNSTLRAEMVMNSNGNAHGGNFEELYIGNKYDGIAMNPPFGVAGKLAMEHLTKAMNHLREGGRIVAIVPTGKMNDRITNWQDSDASEGFHVRARIQLPAMTFERAGTKVMTQVIIIDKVTYPENVRRISPQRDIDLSGRENIKEFFDAIEDLQVPPRVSAGQTAEIQQQQDANAPAVASTTVPQPVAQVATPVASTAAQQTAPVEAAPSNEYAEIVKNFHAKAQRENFVVKLNKRTSTEEFDLMKMAARDLGGTWSSFKGNGAIPGFQFQTMAAANKMMDAISGSRIEAPQEKSLADKIRSWKISTKGGQLYSTIIPGGVQLWNAAVEVVALAVQGGTALADALVRGRSHIEQNWKKPWQKNKYNSEMILALKSKGVLAYNLDPGQLAAADATMRRLAKGAKLLDEMKNLEAGFEYAKNLLTTPEEIQELEDSHREFERYLYDSLAAAELDSTQNFSLGLKEQNWKQIFRTYTQNRFDRLSQIQQAITDSGLTIEEKNDVVNRQDRWKSIAAAKVNKVLHTIGLADVDIFAWKGTRKIKDSLFDRMAQKKVDFNEFGSYIYALHAPERNAQNAKSRRENFAKKLAFLQDRVTELAQDPNAAGNGSLKKAQNQLADYEGYESAYNDPSTNPNLIKLLEKRIDRSDKLMDDGGSGMTNQEAADILARVKALPNYSDFQDFQTELRDKIIQPNLDMQVQYGLIDQASFDNMTAAYKFYVPLNVDEGLFEQSAEEKGRKLPGAKIFKSKGASQYKAENRNNPVTQAIINLQSTIYEGEQNEYKKTMANAIRLAPDSTVWELQSARYTIIKDRAGKPIGMNEIDPPANGTPFYEDGVKKYLVLNDKALRDAVSGDNVWQAIPPLARVNSFLRAASTTFNPEFMASNLIRDLETAGFVMSSQQKADVVGNYTKNVGRILKIIRANYRSQAGAEDTELTKIANRYRELGGEMAYFTREESGKQKLSIEEAYEKYQKSGTFEAGKQLGLRLANFVNEANQAVENASRIAMFDAMVKAGIPEYKAVENARNATVNFQKSGNFGPLMNSAYLFMNASVQGSANMFRTLLTSRRGRLVAGGIAMSGAIMSIYNNLMSECDTDHPEDCYANIPDYDKEKNIIIKNPGGHGFIKIPFAYGFNVFYNFGEQLGEIGFGKRNIVDAGTHVMKTALNSFNPFGGSDTPIDQMLLPTVLDPVVQIANNKDTFGRPIYPDQPWDKRIDSQRASKYDSEAATSISQYLNRITGGNEKIRGKVDIAPGTLDWMFETVTGGLGTFTGKVITTSKAVVDPSKDVEVKKIPIVSRFYTMPDERTDYNKVKSTVDNSGSSILDAEDKAEFEAELQKQVRLGKLSAETAKGYRTTVNKNQYELNNPSIDNFLDRSKRERVSDIERERFVEDLNRKVEAGLIPQSWVRSYKAQVTKNQKKFNPY